MEKRYSRNFPALTAEQFALLRSKKVAVIGCGGLGGHIIEHLSRIGIGAIRCVDGDSFDATNLNRQVLATEGTLGFGKAETAARRVKSINSEVSVECVAQFLDSENASDLIAGCDAVLDALDNIPARRILALACSNAGIPYIYGAISGWVAQAGISLAGDGLIDKLYPNDTVLTDKSVLSFTPALCAAMQTALCVRLLTNQRPEHGKVYYADLSDMEFEEISIM